MRALVVSGAGISAAAGLPTYRGPGGIYPAGVIPLHASDATSKSLPELWERLLPLAAGAAAATPTAAHAALAAFEARAEVTVVTQNVDGLHEVAGSSAVHAMHGSFASVRCLAAGTKHRTAFDAAEFAAAAPEVPRCSVDGSRLRPDVVLFGEQLDATMVRAARAAAQEADLILVVGSSLQVHPVAGLVTTALNAGAVGYWFDSDPAQMLPSVDPADHASFSRLVAVPGDVQEALPTFVADLVKNATSPVPTSVTA